MSDWTTFSNKQVRILLQKKTNYFGRFKSVTESTSMMKNVSIRGKFWVKHMRLRLGESVSFQHWVFREINWLSIMCFPPKIGIFSLSQLWSVCLWHILASLMNLGSVFIASFLTSLRRQTQSFHLDIQTSLFCSRILLSDWVNVQYF